MTQVLPDATFRGKLAGEPLTEGDKEAWAAATPVWFDEGAAIDRRDSVKKRPRQGAAFLKAAPQVRRQRASAHIYGLALDKNLLTLTGRGLERFLPDAEGHTPLMEPGPLPPTLALNSERAAMASPRRAFSSTPCACAVSSSTTRFTGSGTT